MDTLLPIRYFYEFFRHGGDLFIRIRIRYFYEFFRQGGDLFIRIRIILYLNFYNLEETLQKKTLKNLWRPLKKVPIFYINSLEKIFCAEQ